MKKKLLTVAMLCTAVFFAAAGKASSELLNISIFTYQQKEQPPARNTMYKWIREKFGVTFTFDILKGDRYDKTKSLIASGNLPDLVEMWSTDFKDAGCLLDLKNLIEEYAPNLRKHYDSVWEKMLEADNGHIYSLPVCGVYDGPEQGTFYNTNAFWIQKAVLKEFGYPKIKTVDEYFDLLEKYAEKYPVINGDKTIPFIIICSEWEAFNLWNPPTFLAGYPGDGDGHVDKVDGRYVYTYTYTDENARRWFKLANGYYRRGLIDPQTFTDSRYRYETKLSQGRVLGMFAQGWEFMGGSAEFTLTQAGMYERTYAPLPIVFDETITPHYRDRDVFGMSPDGYGITKNCGEKKAIEILKFMDRMLEEENQKTLYWGFEGVDWQKDRLGRPYRTKKQLKRVQDPKYQLNNRAYLWANQAPRLCGSFSDGLACRFEDIPNVFMAEARPEDVSLWNAYGVSSYAALMDADPPELPEWYPMWKNDPAGDTEENAIQYAMQDVMREYIPRLITCPEQSFDALWNEYVSRMQKTGLKKFVGYMQRQLDEKMNRLK